MTITIRRATVDDADAVRRIYLGPRAIWGTNQIPYQSADYWRKRLDDAGAIQLLACVEDDVIGMIGLHNNANSPRRRHSGQIGMAVRDDWQGQGVGTLLMQAVVDLADRWLNLRRLELEVYTDNEPALRLYQKFGFQIEGTLMDYAFRDGQFVDSYNMARLRR
ncbi:MAG: GNAT family N-acetyltransferase [Thermoflexales bacterium]|nr:GNAT family N-acetyltransferase [Thermoflexales bacterium]